MRLVDCLNATAEAVRCEVAGLTVLGTCSVVEVWVVEPQWQCTVRLVSSACASMEAFTGVRMGFRMLQVLGACVITSVALLRQHQEMLAPTPSWVPENLGHKP